MAISGSITTGVELRGTLGTSTPATGAIATGNEIEGQIVGGPPGKDGRSAYQVWLDEGNSGSEQDFIDSLKGDPGPPGTNDYDDLTNKPTLGTAAATDSTDYATAAQGSTADTAIQPGDNITDLTNNAGYTTNTGDVVGPASSTNNSLAYFSDTTGKLLASPTGIAVQQENRLSFTSGGGLILQPYSMVYGGSTPYVQLGRRNSTSQAYIHYYGPFDIGGPANWYAGLTGRNQSTETGIFKDFIIKEGSHTASGTNVFRVGYSTKAITFNEAYTFPTTDGTSNQVLSTDGSGTLSWQTVASGSPDWGDIGGTLSDQTDLQSALDDKADDTTLISALPSTIGSNNQVIKVVGGVPTWAADANTTYAIPSQAEAETGTATNARAFSAQRVNQAIQALAPVKPGDLSTVATTGSYSDLSGTPTLGSLASLNDLSTFDTDDLTEGSTNKYSQWNRVTRNSYPMIEPGSQSDVLHIGTATDFSKYGTLSAAKAWFTAESDGSFFATISVGNPGFLNPGQTFGAVRGRGTLNTPTAVETNDGLMNVTAFGFGSSGDLAITANGKSLFSAMSVKAGTVGATDVAQEVYLGNAALSANAVIRYNSNDQLSFYSATPVSKQTVTGSRGGNAALESLLTALANLGLITNNSTA